MTTTGPEDFQEDLSQVRVFASKLSLDPNLDVVAYPELLQHAFDGAKELLARRIEADGYVPRGQAVLVMFVEQMGDPK